MTVPIGMVSSGASESRATVILYEGMEKVVQNESLVVIRNKNGGDVLAVCRGGRGVNENVRTSGFTPGVAYAKTRRTPSSVKEYYLYSLEVIGAVEENGLQQNKLIIAPTSMVEMFTEEDEKYLSAATIARLRELSFAEEEEEGKAEEVVEGAEVAPAAEVAEGVEPEAEAPEVEEGEEKADVAVEVEEGEREGAPASE